MIKKTISFFISFSLVIIASCSSDDGESCRNNGFLSGTWSDGQELKFNYNVFTQDESDLVEIQSFHDVEFCAFRVGLSVTQISKEVGRKNLIRYNRNGNFSPLSTWVYTLDTDALTEAYLLDSSQNNWIEITEIESNRIKGVINATYIIEEDTSFRAWDFPDTLRFDEANFEFIKFD